MVSAVDTLLASLDRRPWLALAAVVLGALLLGYATLVQQELFVAIWFVFVAFVAHLALRFVRAVERLAGAAERLADGRE